MYGTLIAILIIIIIIFATVSDYYSEKKRKKVRQARVESNKQKMDMSNMPFMNETYASLYDLKYAYLIDYLLKCKDDLLTECNQKISEFIVDKT
jgi:predicted site-specific integrase-resolvase